MLIETRVAGKKRRLLDRWSIPTPPARPDSGDGGLRLRDLIERVVRTEAAAFEQRAKSRSLMRVLSNDEIEDAATKGRVDPARRVPGAPVDADAAVGAALQGFVDGLYLVVLDGVEQTDLDRQVFVAPDSELVFLRLTFLAGA